MVFDLVFNLPHDIIDREEANKTDDYTVRPSVLTLICGWKHEYLDWKQSDTLHPNSLKVQNAIIEIEVGSSLEKSFLLQNLFLKLS